MSGTKRIQDENKRLKGERDLYARILEETNLRFEKKVKKLSLLRNIGDIINCNFDLELFCRKLVDIIIEETNAENCSLMLKDSLSDKLILKVAKGRKDESSAYFGKLDDSKVLFSLGEGVAGKVALEGKPILINDVKNDKRFDSRRKNRLRIGSLMCCPFISQHLVLGVVNLSSSQTNAFNDDDMRVMSIFSAFATSIFTNAISYTGLKESEEKFRTIFEGARDALLIIDPESAKIIDCNRQTVEWLGYTKKELLKMDHLSDLFSPEQKKKEMRQVKKVVKNLIREGTNEITLLGKDGRGRLGEIKAADIRYQGNDLIQLAIRDIAERKDMEEQLKRTKDFLEDVIETIGDGLLISDEKGQIISVNSALENMYDYKRDELVGQHVSVLAMKGDEGLRRRSIEKAAELFEKGHAFQESVFKRDDGKLLEVECNCSMIKDKDGNYIAGVTIFRDVSERKEVEREIREGKDFLENLFKTSTDAILVTDPQGIITMVNDAMEAMVGYSRNELVGKHGSFLSPADKKLRSKALKTVKKLFEEGVIYEDDAIWQRKDGQHILIEANRSLLKDRDGNVTGAVIFGRDVTEKKKVENMLLQSEKLKSLGELAGGVAHDFNNVLAAILGRIQLLKMKMDHPSGKKKSKQLSDDLEKGLDIIEKASLDGSETVRRIQEFSRRRADDEEFRSVDINELIEHALEFTRVRWKDNTESKGINVDIIKEFSFLPPIAGSASELREVFTNFINNAMDAMPKGGQIKIKTFKRGNHIFVKLEDTGVGIPKDIRDRIFDPFFTTKGPQSTGLGMSVSYGIINRHRGMIGVSSTEGKGTMFTIKLPITSEKIREGKRKPLAGKQNKARILVIEDEEGVRELLKDVLIEGGHEVETASRGSEGVKMFKKKDFDLVFTDLGMPGMSGWQVAEKTKKISRHTPVALITGWEIRLEGSELKERGVDLVINKPFQVDQVLELVQKGMKLKGVLEKREEKIGIPNGSKRSQKHCH